MSFSSQEVRVKTERLGSSSHTLKHTSVNTLAKSASFGLPLGFLPMCSPSLQGLRSALPAGQHAGQHAPPTPPPPPQPLCGQPASRAAQQALQPGRGQQHHVGHGWAHTGWCRVDRWGAVPGRLPTSCRAGAAVAHTGEEHLGMCSLHQLTACQLATQLPSCRAGQLPKPSQDDEPRLPKVKQRLHRTAEYRLGIDGRARNNA
ncbi:hypothetical protein V8C86DRAFT_1491564 [Haematococcus lacustris]